MIFNFIYIFAEFICIFRNHQTIYEWVYKFTMFTVVMGHDYDYSTSLWIHRFTLTYFGNVEKARHVMNEVSIHFSQETEECNTHIAIFRSNFMLARPFQRVGHCVHYGEIPNKKWFYYEKCISAISEKSISHKAFFMHTKIMAFSRENNCGVLTKNVVKNNGQCDGR